jgi:hypothetical protein
VARRPFIHAGVYLSYHEMDRGMQGHEAYTPQHAKVAQWVLRLLDKNWQSYFEALVAWQEDPSKVLGRPRLPGYKDKQQGRDLIVYTLPALSIPALRQGKIAPSMLGITVRTKQLIVQRRCASCRATVSMSRSSSMSERQSRQR